MSNKTYESEAAFVRNRIAELITKKNVSERKMSLGLGKSKGYIHNISAGKSLPSMLELFRICDYLEVDLKEFFATFTLTPETEQSIYGIEGIFYEQIDELMEFLKAIKDSRK